MNLEEIYSDPVLYDAEFAARTEDIIYYLDIARSSAGAILEVGCGSGRLTIPIANLGKSVIGIDLVPAMIERAQQSASNADVEISFLLEDCRNFNLHRRFSTIICAANTIQHLLTDEEALSFFGCALRHIEPEGQFVIEAFNPNPSKLKDSAWHLKKKFSFNSGPIEVWCRSNYDQESQNLRFTYSYRNKDQEMHRKEIVIRCFHHHQLVSLLGKSGWRVGKCHGSYDLSTYTENSPLQIFHCTAS